MTCIENIFICMASPLLVAALCMGRRRLRFFLFGVAGMGVCLLSAYINTFLAAVCRADALAATAEIAPVVEEMMKLLPLVFYLLVFEPEGDKIKAAAITVALAFATFENVCYLIQNGADRFSFIFFRGFGTGAMHVLCGLIVGGGLAYTWRRTWLKVAGTCGLLGAAITLHAIYNLLIAHGGAAQYIAYALPVLLVATAVRCWVQNVLRPSPRPRSMRRPTSGDGCISRPQRGGPDFTPPKDGPSRPSSRLPGRMGKRPRRSLRRARFCPATPPERPACGPRCRSCV